jgi:hypothetical protein
MWFPPAGWPATRRACLVQGKLAYIDRICTYTTADCAVGESGES